MSEASRWLECQDASEYLENRLTKIPEWAIVTGTGLSGIRSHFKVLDTIPYLDIPNMPSTTVSSHEPEVCLVDIEGTKALLFCGRFHHYEGRSMHEVTFAIRICQGLNISKIILTNAAGGLHQKYATPEIVTLSDHIYLLPDNPLRGLTMEEWGDRFPDPKFIYDLELRSKARSYLMDHNLPGREGIYACVTGPALETRAELRYLKTIGADLIGMSTVPEVLVAAQCRMKVLALSVVTNVVDPDQRMTEVELEDVIAISEKIGPQLAGLISHVTAQK